MLQERRIRAYVNIQIKPSYSADFLAVIRNISLTGCFLATEARLKQAQQVFLLIPLRDDGKLRLHGTVVRWQEGATGGYGISFDPDSIAEAGQQALALLIAESTEPAA